MVASEAASPVPPGFEVNGFVLVPQNFGAPSFDDKKLEVVAVFGSMQMAMSRVINLQHHRIAQVNHLIPGEEPVT